jgi:hypothetical protein
MMQPAKTSTLSELRDLTDEVRQLHPLLNILLPKLPAIVRAIYSQGTDELGADFVLVKNEEALQKHSYIGVVVKIGTIRQNHPDVERQIGECFVERKLPDGTDIHIREVWVLCTGEITSNARRVIAKKYTDEKIEFIDGQLLAQMIDKYAPNSFVTVAPLLQDYAESLRRNLDHEELNSVVVAGMEALYVEPDIGRVEFDHRGYTNSIKRGLTVQSLINAARTTQFAVVRAGAGGGKSKLGRELVRGQLDTKEFFDGKIIPVVFHGRHFIERTIEKMETAIRAARGTCSETQAARVILYIDGFDEIDITDSARTAYIKELRHVAGADGNVSVWLLTRPFDETEILGSAAQSTDVFEISPLKGQKALKLLSAVSKNIDVKHRLAESLKGSALIRALDGAPIAYILLGRLLAENEQELPSSLTELFQKYCELFLGRWEIDKGLRIQKEYEVLVEALTWLAGYMIDNSLYKVAQSEIADHIDSYCKARNIKVSARDLLAKASQRSGIIFSNGDDSIGFRHRAFAEYFYARGLNGKGKLSLMPDVFDPYWVNSYFFYVGMQRDCPSLVTELAEMVLEDESPRLMRVVQFGNILMAAYLTPTATIAHCVEAIAKDAAKLYIAACDPSYPGQLKNFATMQLLGIFASFFKEQYGYALLKEAIGAAMLEIDDAWEKNEEAAIALFLLAIAYRESGGSLRFDDLIEEFGDALPLVVKLGIGHESERMKVLTDKVKKMEKHLRRNAQASAASNEFFKNLYDTAVVNLPKKLMH